MRARHAAARGGLCAVCTFARVIESAKGSRFLRCDHPQLPRYPAMPVRVCVGFSPLTPDS